MEGTSIKYKVELIRDNDKQPAYKIAVTANSTTSAIYKAKLFVAKNGSWNINSSIDNRINRLRVFDVYEEKESSNESK